MARSSASADTPAPLYADTELLCQLLLEHFGTADHALPQAIAKVCIQLLADVVLALRGVERALRIDRADHALIVLRAELRLAQRLGLLSEWLLLRSLELCDQLGRQLGGWRRSLAAKSPPLDS